jgi:hypothetical protein
MLRGRDELATIAPQNVAIELLSLVLELDEEMLAAAVLSEVRFPAAFKGDHVAVAMRLPAAQPARDHVWQRVHTDDFDELRRRRIDVVREARE